MTVFEKFAHDGRWLEFIRWHENVWKRLFENWLVYSENDTCISLIVKFKNKNLAYNVYHRYSPYSPLNQLFTKLNHWTSYLLNWTIEPVIYLIEPLNQLFTKLNHWTSYLLNWTIEPVIY